MSPYNKPRLYVVLYSRGTVPEANERRFHWALAWGRKFIAFDQQLEITRPTPMIISLTSPPAKNEVKDDEGFKCHVKDTLHEDYRPGTWRRETIRVKSGAAEGTSVARVMVGKVLSEFAMKEVLLRVPVVQGDPNWTSDVFVKNALAALATSRAIGTSVDLEDWQKIEDTAKTYANDKIDAGRFRAGTTFDISRIPTLDMISGKETVP